MGIIKINDKIIKDNRYVSTKITSETKEFIKKTLSDQVFLKSRVKKSNFQKISLENFFEKSDNFIIEFLKKEFLLNDTIKNTCYNEIIKRLLDSIDNKSIMLYYTNFDKYELSGYCVYDEIFPIICVNSNLLKHYQVFSIITQLINIIFKLSYIDLITFLERQNRVSLLTKNIMEQPFFKIHEPCYNISKQFINGGKLLEAMKNENN